MEDGLVIDLDGSSFTGGGNVVTEWWGKQSSKQRMIAGVVAGVIILGLIGLIIYVTIGGFAQIQPTAQYTGATPSTRYVELSQPGAGGEGLVFDETTRTYVYKTAADAQRTLIAAMEGGTMGFSNEPTYSKWARDDREKKGMRMYASLRQAATAQGKEMTMSFDEWYKSWRTEPENRLAGDVYYHRDSMHGGGHSPEFMTSINDGRLSNSMHGM